MTSTQHFRIKKPNVIFESFDNEVVLINLDNGNYYSIQGVASEIWELIEGGIPLQGIISHISNRYRGGQKEVEQAVRQFLEELSQDGLIEVSEPEERGGKNPGHETESTEKASDRPVFEPPTLNRYTDMQDLLLLDPIHDVSEQGWPTPQSNAQPQSEKAD
jgi:hypothetical protein